MQATKSKKKMKYVFQKPLGDAVLRARGESKLTQSQVAAMIEIDSRTILNIEKYEGKSQTGSSVPSSPFVGN